MDYEDFAVGIEGSEEDGWVLRVLHSLEGTASTAFAPPWSRAEVEELLAGLDGAVRRRRRTALPDPAAPDPRAVGARLFDALFTSSVRDRWLYSRGRVADRADAGLRLRLHFDLADPAAAALAALPWELVYDTERNDFLARSRGTPVVRYLEVTGRVDPPAVEPPLSILVAGASPRGAEPLDIEAEVEALRRAWAGDAPVEIHALPHTTPEELRRTLIARSCHVLHLVAHGDQPAGGEGVVLLERPGGGPRLVGAEVLAQTLRDVPTLRLVVLGSCSTAAFPRRDGIDPFTGTAIALVAGGLPAVLAMQFPISDLAAVELGHGLYPALAAGEPIEAAVVEARQAIYTARPDTYEWATPVLFLRSSEGRVLGPLIEHGGTSPAVRARILDATPLIEEKSRGFVGRDFVFAALERFLGERPCGYFKISGEPGIGKTAVAAELVRRGRERARDRHLHHFNQRAEGIVRPESFLANVCAQLIETFALPHATLPPEATRDAAVLRTLLFEASRRLPGGERCVVVVDALDEACGDGLPAGVNPLFLPSQVPAGFYFVVTHRHPGPPLRLEEAPGELLVRHDSPENRADVRDYVASYLPFAGVRRFLAAHQLSEDDFVERMETLSQGNFMYLSHVLPAVSRGEYRDGGDPLPCGLLGYYEQQWRRMRGGDEEALLAWKLPVLEALAVADQPLPRHLVILASGVEKRRVLHALELWRPFLHVVEPPGGEGSAEPLYRLYHESFRDFLAARPEVDLEEARGRLFEGFVRSESAAPGE